MASTKFLTKAFLSDKAYKLLEKTLMLLKRRKIKLADDTHNKVLLHPVEH
jgi:hypothetical protein